MIFLYFASDEFASRAKVLTDSIAKYHPRDTIVHVNPGSGPLGTYLPGMAKKRLKKALELIESEHEDVCIIGADCELYKTLQFPYRNIQDWKKYDVIIVPHVPNPLKDREYMAQIYETGHANADLILFLNNTNSKNILKWLISVTEDGHKPGAFYEQTWLSSLPFLFEGVGIWREIGVNTGYWNVNQVGVKNLTMFQFSGYEKDKPEEMSRHSKEKARTEEILNFYKAYDAKIEK